MYLKKKLKYDNKGITGVNVIIILVLILIIWELAGGYLGIITPSEFLKDTVNEDIPDNITMSYEVFNIQNSTMLNKGIVPDDINFPNMVDNTTVLEIGDNDLIEFHEIVITTNAPKILIGTPYHIRITAEEHLIGSNNFHNYLDYDIRTGTGDKTIRYRLQADNCQVAGWLNEWTEVIIQLTSPDGNIVDTEIFYLF